MHLADRGVMTARCNSDSQERLPRLGDLMATQRDPSHRST